MIPKTNKTLIDVLQHLYKLADDFPYSQLSLCLDSKSLFDLMRVFGGKSLYIPTVTEFTQLLQFCLVEEVGSYEEAIEINKEALSGFTKTRYDRLADQIYNRTPETKRRKRNNKRRSRENNKPADQPQNS